MFFLHYFHLYFHHLHWNKPFWKFLFCFKLIISSCSEKVLNLNGIRLVETNHLQKKIKLWVLVRKLAKFCNTLSNLSLILSVSKRYLVQLNVHQSAFTPWEYVSHLFIRRRYHTYSCLSPNFSYLIKIILLLPSWVAPHVCFLFWIIPGDGKWNKHVTILKNTWLCW